MSLIVNTNVASLRAQNALEVSQQSVQKSFLRLSSGYRINSAADDAAGLGISEGLRAKIRSFTVAERNTNNAISMANVAEGGLAQVSSIVGQALHQLARQLPGPGRSETDRAGETFAQCDAIVGVARRQVEHVACIEHKLLLGHKG